MSDMVEMLQGGLRSLRLPARRVSLIEKIWRAQPALQGTG